MTLRYEFSLLATLFHFDKVVSLADVFYSVPHTNCKPLSVHKNRQSSLRDIKHMYNTSPIKGSPKLYTYLHPCLKLAHCIKLYERMRNPNIPNKSITYKMFIYRMTTNKFQNITIFHVTNDKC